MTKLETELTEYVVGIAARLGELPKDNTARYMVDPIRLKLFWLLSEAGVKPTEVMPLVHPNSG